VVERGENRVGVYQIDTPQRKTINGRRVLSFPVHLDNTSGLGIPSACTCVGVGTLKRRRNAFVKQPVYNPHSKRNHCEGSRHCCF